MTLGISFSTGFIKLVYFSSIIFSLLFVIKNVEAKEIAEVWFNSLWIFCFLLVFRKTNNRLLKEEFKYSQVIKNPVSRLFSLLSVIVISHIIIWTINSDVNFAAPIMIWLGITLFSILLMYYYDWKLKLYNKK